MLIDNYKELAISPERRTLLDFASEGIESMLPEKILPKLLRHNNAVLTAKGKEFSLNKRIFVVGAGKASGAMAQALEEIIGAEKITDGIVLASGTGAHTRKIKIIHADHPIPTLKNMMATESLLALKEKHSIREDDLIISLISGGGSAMLIAPVFGVTLEDKKKLTEILISHGAAGYENTTIKSKLSRAKGGKLAAYFAPTPVLSLVLSDDNGEAGHEMTASGPFFPDKTTHKDALGIIEKLNIAEKIPSSILSYICARAKEEPASPLSFSHVHQIIVGSNEHALKSIENAAKKKSIKVIKRMYVKGEALDVAKSFLGEIKNTSIKAPTLFLWGGETRVTVGDSRGIGGRNQELALACLKELEKDQHEFAWCIASIATDGVDFIECAAGVIIDKSSLQYIKEKNINIEKFLSTHNSYPILSRMGSVISTGGPTGTQVGDIIMALIVPKRGATKPE